MIHLPCNHSIMLLIGWLVMMLVLHWAHQRPADLEIILCAEMGASSRIVSCLVGGANHVMTYYLYLIFLGPKQSNCNESCSDEPGAAICPTNKVRHRGRYLDPGSCFVSKCVC